jgi:outer membrane murein-binding lipoprotein Lpp
MRRHLFLLLSSAIIIVGCSSNAQNNTTTTTTIDPQVAALQEQVDQLKTQINATTVAPKPTARPYITRTGRFPTTYSKPVPNGQKSYECRVIDYYSDGTSVEGSRYWVTVDKWYYGACG